MTPDPTPSPNDWSLTPMTDLTPGHPGWHGSLEGEPINDTPLPQPTPPEQEWQTIDQWFRIAYSALRQIVEDETVEEYWAGGLEDTTIELAGMFGYSVDHMGDLYLTPSCNEEPRD